MQPYTTRASRTSPFFPRNNPLALAILNGQCTQVGRKALRIRGWSRADGCGQTHGDFTLIADCKTGVRQADWGQGIA